MAHTLEQEYRWDVPDIDALRMLAEMPFERRLLSMMQAQRTLLDTIRGQLRIVHPEMDTQELNLLVFEEIHRRQERADRLRTHLARRIHPTSSP